MLQFFKHLDRRIIFVLILISCALPLLFPIGLPIHTSKPVEAVYQYIERLPPGSRVLVTGDYDPGSLPELYPMNMAIFKHLFERGMKVYAIELWPQGQPLVQRAWQNTGVLMGKTYGQDFVNLGYKSGQEVVMVKMGTSIAETFPTDYTNTPVAQIPMMQGIQNYNDIDFIVNISAGYPGTKEWVQQVVSRYNKKMASGTTAVSAPEYYAYYQSGQIVGLIGGLKGAAEYEKLVGIPFDDGTVKIGALAQKGMDAQSLVHLIIVVFIIIGNTVYFFERKQGLNQNLNVKSYQA